MYKYQMQLGTNLWHIVKAQNVLLFILDIVMRVYITQEQKQQMLGTPAHQKKEVGRSEFVYGA